MELRENYLLNVRGKLTVLSREEEVELAKRVKEKDEAARKEFILHNLPLVIHVAVKCQRNGVPLSDTIQMGMEGLIQAVEHFDWERGFRFSTYAVRWIQQAIWRGSPRQRRMIRLPAYQENRVREYTRRKEKADATGEAGKNDKEIFDEMGLPEKSWELLMEAVRVSTPPLSIDGPTSAFSSRHDGEGATLGEVIPDERAVTEKDLIDAMDRERRAREILNLKALTGKEREVLLVLYGFYGGIPRTLQQTGDYFRVSRERIRQIERGALKKIWAALGIPEPPMSKKGRRPKQEA